MIKSNFKKIKKITFGNNYLGYFQWLGKFCPERIDLPFPCKEGSYTFLHHKKNAFAFIELLVHLAITSILLAVILTYHTTIQKKIALRLARREISILKLGVNSYYENRNPKEYPPPTDKPCEQYLVGAKPQVIHEILYDKFSRKKQEYQYTLSPNGKFYCIWTIGINRKSDIRGIDDKGNVLKTKNCDDLYATLAFDPPKVE